MKNTHLPSKRKYVVAFIEGTAAVTQFPSLSEILEDSNDEWKYALQEHLDRVLDLKVGERIQLHFNRDNADSLGQIKRVE
jgi:hypothetical protein